MPGMGATSKGINYKIIRPDKQNGQSYTPGHKPQLSTYDKGGRVGKQFGGGLPIQPTVGANLQPTVGANLQPTVGATPMGGAAPGRRFGMKHGSKSKSGRVGLKKGGDKNWIQDVNKSIKARGTKGKCTPITKPGCTGRAKALAKTFKKMAKKRKS